jgi:hypothetical protein
VPGKLARHIHTEKQIQYNIYCLHFFSFNFLSVWRLPVFWSSSVAAAAAYSYELSRYGVQGRVGQLRCSLRKRTSAPASRSGLPTKLQPPLPPPTAKSSPGTASKSGLQTILQHNRDMIICTIRKESVPYNSAYESAYDLVHLSPRKANYTAV